MKTHTLKTWTEVFPALIERVKPFEVRKNDRDYQVGDILELKEYDPATETYTGRWVARTVTYVLPGGRFGIKKGYCVLGLTT